jgi:dolichyl-diphosphooligosaccharide--protein glycosyltransferase
VRGFSSREAGGRGGAEPSASRARVVQRPTPPSPDPARRLRRPAAASGTDTLPAARGIQGGPADLLIGDGLHAMILRVLLFLYFCRCAYTIRLHAIEEYGLVIHEFDPWFNYRATEYLAQHGYEKFFKWYDYMSWYPLGRPVGTTIYPGMQLTSVAIWNVLNGLGIEISLNDVCCYVPAWFGVLATIFLTMLTYECSGSANGAVAAAGIMAVVPAHIMRSVGGGYDNESVAMTAMCCTFYFWCRSLRGDASWPIGIVAGIAYIYMAAAWGGYIFVVNMIGVHAIGLVFLGRYSNKLHHAYTLFYIIGTIGAPIPQGEGAALVPLVGPTAQVVPAVGPD